ncbi:MAG: bifunctional demethylmenaquinone methyltransferase/2-methoxy-6-polyprenyl-1,4-benzoquinol methylase UbiE [Phycisphaerae bacterium]|nr:bifunctional demethylmenaquinone methyltransferase/2-methoxy-6-polyprenyl-1,4-benzoquinol methylase UbiE [Phycisphaerae bacterium]
MPTASRDTLWDDARLSDPHAQPDKSRRVQAMFDAIAPTYELVNRVLSAGRDAFWRRTAVSMAAVRSDDRVLDLACGTGDFARAFHRAKPSVIVGSDFSAGMLGLAARRAAETPRVAGASAPIRWCRGDAHNLPFADGSFSIASCAFGVRNFQHLEIGLREMNRVLAVGGRAVILEFTMPRSKLLGRIYRFYFRRVLPRVARWISRDRSGAYDYLPNSVESFIDERGMVKALQSVGFGRIECRTLSAGIVAVYVATKPKQTDGTT